MTSNRSSLPILASRVPRVSVSASTPKTKTSNLSKRTVKSVASVERSGIAKPSNSKGRRPETRSRPLESKPTTTAPVLTTGWLPAYTCQGLETIFEDDESESTFTSNSETNSEDSNDSTTTLPSSISSTEPSRYNGPQLVEPCVSNALLHVLEPCGHRVMTRHVESCGKNCKSTDAAFANTKTTAKFACAVCMSKYVHEHYSAQKSLFVSSLDKLEIALGGFRVSWKAERIARMERVWKNDAGEERKALEKLGRYCEVIPTDPDEEVLLITPTEVAPVKDASFQVPVQANTVKRQLPVSKKPKEKRQIPTLQSLVSVEENSGAGKRGKIGSSRIPVGPSLSKK
jgi:hypothetical protein